MSHSLSSNFFFSYLNTTSIANNTFISYPFILTTMALPIFYRTKNSLTKKPTHFWFKSSVINCFRSSNLTKRIFKNCFWRGKTYNNFGKIAVFICLIRYHKLMFKVYFIVISSASPLSSCINTLNDSGIPGVCILSPLTIASYAFALPIISSDLIVRISCRT